jgi:hypothetical protein
MSTSSPDFAHEHQIYFNFLEPRVMVSGIALIQKKNLENLIYIFFNSAPPFYFQSPIIFSIASFSSQFHHQMFFL